MSWFEAFILGILQGLTEFFPVSSSAHLKLAKIFLGLGEGSHLLIFDLMCHLGTLVALLYFFRHEIRSLILFEHKKLLLFILALVPLIPFYFLLKPVRDYFSQIQLLGFCLIATSAILFAGGRWKIKQEKDLSLKGRMRDVLWIGAMQSAALIPGISRSASTISAARSLGWEAKEAVRFSFLLAIPTIIGGNSLELIRLLLKGGISPSLSFSSCLIGFLSSLGIGWLVIRFAIARLEKGNLNPFAWYCLCLGIAVTVYTYYL